MENPFIKRNLPLSELLQMQQRYGADGGGWYQQAQLRNTNEAIDQFGRRRQPMPMPQPRPRQMMPQPRPQPRQMMPQPLPAQQPMPMSSPGMMLPAAGMGTPGTVTVSGGGMGAPMPPPQQAPAFGGFWNTLGLGGQIPPMGGGRGFGYGGFGGFSQQQPYQGGGFNRLY